MSCLSKSESSPPPPFDTQHTVISERKPVQIWATSKWNDVLSYGRRRIYLNSLLRLGVYGDGGGKCGIFTSIVKWMAIRSDTNMNVIELAIVQGSPAIFVRLQVGVARGRRHRWYRRAELSGLSRNALVSTILINVASAASSRSVSRQLVLICWMYKMAFLTLCSFSISDTTMSYVWWALLFASS